MDSITLLSFITALGFGIYIGRILGLSRGGD